MASHLASLWKRDFLELGSGLFYRRCMMGKGGGGQVRTPHHKNVFEITRLCEAHSDTPLPLQVSPTNRSFHVFFEFFFRLVGEYPLTMLEITP